MGALPWWRGCVVYQVYVRSFFDADCDGHGDLNGVLAKLDYVRDLGVDAIWLSPIHPSPNRDWGYDVADYDQVAEDYGGLPALERLLQAAHARGIRVLLDEVLAHTSDQHAWFLNSLSRCDKANWYVWADGRSGGPPNNWIATFGGPAWTWSEARGQYYHHKFLPQQPKLNWNEPAAKAAALQVLDAWLGRGVDGFRLDVAGALLHDPALTDNPPGAGIDGQSHRYDANRPGNLELLAEIRRLAERHGDRFVFGEFFEEPDLCGAYAAPDEGVHSAYTFPLMLADELGPRFVREHFATLAAHPRHWPSVALSNHDVKRARTRFGGPDAPRALADLLLVLLLSLKGTVLLYQGEELGLPQAEVAPDERRDPIRAVNRLDVGRDGARTPMPWTEGPNLGFSAGRPWLPVGREHVGLSVESQEADPGSSLHLARRLIRLRRDHAALRWGEIEFLEVREPWLVFVRDWDSERILCALNMSGAKAAPPSAACEGTTLAERDVASAYGWRIARL